MDQPKAEPADRDRLRQEQVQAQKTEVIGQLASGIAHEVNNALAAMVAYSELIRRDRRLTDDLRHDAELLVQEAERTRRIVQNLLDVSGRRSGTRLHSEPLPRASSTSRPIRSWRAESRSISTSARASRWWPSTGLKPFDLEGVGRTMRELVGRPEDQPRG